MTFLSFGLKMCHYQTWKIIEQRRQLKVGSFDLNGYRSLSREIQRNCRKDKDKYVSNICQEVEIHLHRNETRDLLQKVKLLTREFKPRNYAIEDETEIEMNYEEEQKYLQRLLEEVNSNDELEYDDSADSSEEDEVEIQDLDTDSEQDIPEAENDVFDEAEAQNICRRIPIFLDESEEETEEDTEMKSEEDSEEDTDTEDTESEAPRKAERKSSQRKRSRRAVRKVALQKLETLFEDQQDQIENITYQSLIVLCDLSIGNINDGNTPESDKVKHNIMKMYLSNQQFKQLILVQSS
ncbi:acidic leucine-rich nuclear phosphoprotein 32 family member A-like [Diabrotica virgifera virgifera]|uniref:Uncharacterized protein n=1 Tax=Diabrotica virgifera virgifera TaxID=50390 RepID=A0ABM5KHM3_DIAVI|nr:acidic leucine-rich nuclear phosphoprotein 32 family member A-like [Diabrotica virgifera virgifera]